MSTYGSSRSGFSLPEVLVLMVIFGIVVASAIPNLSSYVQTQKVARACEQVASVCRSARSQARLENHNIVIEYRPSDNTFAVLEDENNNGVADPQETRTVYDIPAGVTLSSTTFPNDELSFDGRGRALAGGSVLLQAGANTQPKRVRVSSGTGHVRIRGSSS